AVGVVATPDALASVADFPAVRIPLQTVSESLNDARLTQGVRPLDAPRSPESAALLLHSSGTTGLPKIVVRSGDSLDLVAAAMAESVGFRPTDRVLACVPLCHSYGVEHGLLAPLWAGSTVRLC